MDAEAHRGQVKAVMVVWAPRLTFMLGSENVRRIGCSATDWSGFTESCRIPVAWRGHILFRIRGLSWLVSGLFGSSVKRMTAKALYAHDQAEQPVSFGLRSLMRTEVVGRPLLVTTSWDDGHPIRLACGGYTCEARCKWELSSTFLAPIPRQACHAPGRYR